VTASAFYDFQAVLVPHGLSPEVLISYLQKSEADVLIAEAGALELSSMVENVPSLTHIIWVAKHGNRHMDWNEVPEGIGGKIEVTTWHDLVEEHKSYISMELPSSEKGSSINPLITFWPPRTGEVGDIVELTSGVSKNNSGLLFMLTGPEHGICHCLSHVFLTPESTDDV
jgi:hypothetical protein